MCVEFVKLDLVELLCLDFKAKSTSDLITSRDCECAASHVMLKCLDWILFMWCLVAAYGHGS